MKTGILTFEQFHGKKDIGSSRIRGHWIVKHWKEVGDDIGDCEIFKYGQHYDCVIYQKAYFVDHAREFKGKKILDLCDPDWLIWTGKVVEMIQEVDAITCSSLELTKAVSKFTDKPVYLVPDRVDFTGLPAPKKHYGPTKRIVWFGYSHNFPILDSTINALNKRGLDLIVIADNIYSPPAAFKIKLENFPFNGLHYMNDIQKGDVVINPRFTKGKWKYKSENKTAIAWALGMPVAHTEIELDTLLTQEQRQKSVEKSFEKAKNEFDIKLSVVDYKDIIQEIKK